MTHNYILPLLQSKKPDKFDHFDYVDAIQQLTPLERQSHPKKRRLIQQFVSKCRQRIQQESKQKDNNAKYRNFIDRMQVYQSIRKQKLQALRFIEEKYDSKNKQLLFYPKINHGMATQKMRYWKDLDGFEAIQNQSKIYEPHQSIFEAQQKYQTRLKQTNY